MIPVIAIDGPSASGKGTVAQRVAQHLGFHYLDSGALYRIAAYFALQHKISEFQESVLVKLIDGLHIQFNGTNIVVNNQDVTELIRSEQCGQFASKIAAVKAVRHALLDLQQRFCRAPGLVADGRDMASVVFPNSVLKIFLTASPEIRAQRRYKQLIDKGISASIDVLLQDILERDRRDETRVESPLKLLPDAHFLDTSAMTVDEAVKQVIDWYTQIIQ